MITIESHTTGRAHPPATWWRHGVLYQIYPRSFADSNGDGVGDLRGLIEHLDHLEWLGIDGIWLNPSMPSPNDDWGYDVSGYCDVHPELGTLDDLDELVAEAARRGIQILLDLVPNHTSIQHPWFQEAVTGRDAPYRDFYVWADPGPDGSPPNNWRSTFGGSAWEYHEPTGQYYLRNFLPSQADLNWWNPHVREAFDEILRFWFDRGVAGFRIDVAQAIIHDHLLRDDPPATPDDPVEFRELGLQQRYSMNRPEGHEVLRRWRELAAATEPERVLVGETYVFDLDQLTSFYGNGDDELHLAFNIPFIHAPLEAEPLRTVVEAMEAKLPGGAWPTWTGSNHDLKRLTRRWAKGDPARVRCALMMLLCLRGTPVLYYGDEIGMDDVPIDVAMSLDPVGRRTGNPARNRDPGRTPMQWNADAGAGFTSSDTSWLPIGDAAACNVADQREDPASTLHLVRDLIALRRRRDDLSSGRYETLPAPDGAWVWRRGDRTVCALNLSSHDVAVAVGGTVLVGTDRTRDGQPFDGHLAPWEGAVVELAPTG